MNDWLETEGESAKITSSISEAEGNGESVITFKDEQEEPIGYLSYHLNRINKSVNVNSVWTHPDRRREGIASQLLENLRAKYPKSDGWRLDVSWTTDDGTAWAEANDDSIDLGNYKTANSWDEEPNNNPQLIRLASSWDELDDSNQLWPLKESNWDEIENDLSQMPLTNSVCPKCKADAYKWFDKDESHPNDGTFLCPECQHLTGITDNNELFSYVPPGSVFENLVLNKYRMSSVPQKFGNSWSDQEPKGQAFMPLDEEWMERNRSKWQYYCPHCSSSSVMIGPTKENNYQIPDWEESSSLVNRIKEFHADNPHEDIDYCPDCEKVWIRPEFDFVMHKNTSVVLADAYEDAKELLSNDGGWRGIPSPDKDDMAKYWRGRYEPWTKGEWGKGVINSDGEVVTWNVSKDGYPHHDSVGGDYETSIWIAPDGYFTTAGWINTNGHYDVSNFFQEDIHIEPFAQLGLKYMDPWDWVMEYWGNNTGGGYGHAQNILDILNRQAGYEFQF